MKRIFRYTTILIALSLVTSCNLIEEENAEGSLIRFAPQSVETKSMITSSNLTQQSFSVVDLMGETAYINDVITYSDNAWNYTSGNTYYWIEGSHKFFGYNAGSLSGTTLTVATNKALTTEPDDQTDLLYSGIVSTTAADWKEVNTVNTPVSLRFHHLLSAVSFTLENHTGADLTVNAVSVSLPNTGTASVSFAGSDPAPTVTVDTEHPGVFGSYNPQGGLSLGADAICDALTGGTTATSYMIWPQTLAEHAAVITVSLTMDGDTFDRTVYIPKDTEWIAGKINTYNLVIYPEELALTFVVQDWDKADIPASINTSTGSINMTNVTWMNSKVKLTQDGEEINTVVNSAYSVTMYYNPYVLGQNGTWSEYGTYYPAQGYFTVNYPLSGKFKLGLIPAYGETTVAPDKYAFFIYDTNYTGTGAPWRPFNTEGENITHDTIYFQVRPASENNSQQYKAQLDIWFNPDNDDSDEWISAYSEVRANYALIIPAHSSN